MVIIRAVCFYAGYTAATLLWGSFGTLFGWLLPYRLRFRLIVVGWTGFCLNWLRLTCGIGHEVHGLDNIPERPCIVLCRHESTWETLFLQQLFRPQATLIKRELLHIPFFGWAFRTLRPIAIDRRQHRQALRTLIDEGRSRLADGIWVVLFPEGTRMPTAKIGRFQPGGAALAAATGVPILLVVHDAGAYWPAHAFRKRPGTVRVLIGKPLDTAERSTKEIQAACAAQFEALMHQLPRSEPIDEPAAVG